MRMSKRVTVQLDPDQWEELKAIILFAIGVRPLPEDMVEAE